MMNYRHGRPRPAIPSKSGLAHEAFLRKPPSASYPLTPDRSKTQKEGVLALANEGYQVKSLVDRTDRQNWGLFGACRYPKRGFKWENRDRQAEFRRKHRLMVPAVAGDDGGNAR